MKHKALNQLVCAALVNDGFCEALLHDPARAITNGYYGNKFLLTSEEKDMLVDIRAQGLEDFAEQIYSWISRDNPKPRMLLPRHPSLSDRRLNAYAN